jgi:glycosyltransferase involved in cell wall biosynthesis
LCALRSLARQQTGVDHVVVVDDGSCTPLNLGLAVQWFSSATKLEIIRQDPNQGPASARNRGVSATTCTYISFLDHDDLAHPLKIERQLQCLRAGADVVVPLALSFSQLSENLTPATFGDPYAMPIGLMMRRSKFERLGGMKDIFGGDDMELIMNARMSGLRIEFLEEVLLYRRVGESNLSLKIDRRRAMLRAASAALKHSVAT